MATPRRNGAAIVPGVGIRDVDRGFPRELGFPDPESRAFGLRQLQHRARR